MWLAKCPYFSTRGRWAVKKGQKYVMWFVNYQKIAVYRGNSDMGRSLGQKCILKDDSLEVVYV